jgi:hypothetical protein
MCLLPHSPERMRHLGLGAEMLAGVGCGGAKPPAGLAFLEVSKAAHLLQCHDCKRKRSAPTARDAVVPWG